MASRLREAALADLSGLKARHRESFAIHWPRRSVYFGVTGVLAGLLIYGLYVTGFSWSKVFNGFGELFRIVGLMFPPDYGNTARLLIFLHALGETLAIAFLGTLFAAILAGPLALLAARNTTVNGIARFFARRSSDVIRGVDSLIWALIWINVVGLGPFAGMLAIMTSDIGSFTKLFSEAIEAADNKAVEGVVSTGGTKGHATRFGVIPQVLPVIASQVLYYFESNTRSSTIIGIVGAGGIGLHLSETIRTLEFQEVSFLILMILVTVSIIDYVSAKLRFAIIGTSAAPVN